jgi:hypothetical protein
MAQKYMFYIAGMERILRLEGIGLY